MDAATNNEPQEEPQEDQPLSEEEEAALDILLSLFPATPAQSR